MQTAGAALPRPVELAALEHFRKRGTVSLAPIVTDATAGTVHGRSRIGYRADEVGDLGHAGEGGIQGHDGRVAVDEGEVEPAAGHGRHVGVLGPVDLAYQDVAHQAGDQRPRPEGRRPVEQGRQLELEGAAAEGEGLDEEGVGPLGLEEVEDEVPPALLPGLVDRPPCFVEDDLEAGIGSDVDGGELSAGEAPLSAVPRGGCDGPEASKRRTHFESGDGHADAATGAGADSREIQRPRGRAIRADAGGRASGE